MQEIKVFTFHYLTDTNSYLVKTDTGLILIDTGHSTNRKDLEGELEKSGCTPGNLKLILVTHGHFDHTGNCAYLREKYGAEIAMHKGDLKMVESGDMFYNKGIIMHMIAKIMFSLLRSGNYDKFKPDIFVEDGQELSMYGLDAKVIHIPGHSKGSIGILTAGGNLFCGDLLTNIKEPAKKTLVDDKEELDASVEKTTNLKVNTIYPGHGMSFSMEQFKQLSS